MGRARATVIESRAGETPSVNLPVLPVLENEANGTLYRWGRSLVAQLEIWFTQIKDTIVAIQRGLLERTSFDSDYSPGDEVAYKTMVHDNGWLMVSNAKTTDRAAPVPTGPVESLYTDSPAWDAVNTQNAKVTVRHTIDIDQGTAIILKSLRVWIPAPAAAAPAVTVTVAIRRGLAGTVETRTLNVGTGYTPDQWVLLSLGDEPLPMDSQIVTTMEYDASPNTRFVSYASYWVANEPSWGSVTGQLFYNDVEQGGQATNGFGMDVSGIPATVSADWDYMSYSPVGATGDADLQSNEVSKWSSSETQHLTTGSVSTTNNSWTEVLRLTLDRSTYGQVITRANRTDAADVYNSQIAFSALLNAGTLTVSSQTVFEISTAPTLRVRVDSSTNELVFDVQGAINQNWDWDMRVLTSDYV